MERIEASKELIDSLAQKLDAFEQGLSPEEREVLGAVFAAAGGGTQADKGDVEGFRAGGAEMMPIAIMPLAVRFRSIFQPESPVELTPIQLP